MDIYQKLKNMKKVKLEKICRKIKCPVGTKKEMIINLLRPFYKKYKMKTIPTDILGLVLQNVPDRYLQVLSQTDKEFTNLTTKEIIRRNSERIRDLLTGYIREDRMNIDRGIRPLGNALYNITVTEDDWPEDWFDMTEFEELIDERDVNRDILEEINYSNVDFRDLDLRDTDLRNLDLSNTLNLDRANLNGAKYDNPELFPREFNFQEKGMVLIQE
tara:strand:- start:491 stop:1138 length:648 start_codon:yes stop_codon:yes gene_type:complete